MTVRTCSTNETLADAPELVNQDCYGEGWILVVRPAAAAGEDLLDATVYAKHPADRAD